MDLQLNDKTVLVTGAGQGLGRAIGVAFAREGADGAAARLALVLVDHRADHFRQRRVRDAVREAR